MSSSAHLHLAGKHAVVIEPDPALRTVIASVLTRAGMRVEDRESLPEELTTAPDVVVASLPPLAEGAYAEQVEELVRRLPAPLVLLGDQDDNAEARREALHAGAAAFVIKPPSGPELLADVTYAITTTPEERRAALAAEEAVQAARNHSRPRGPVNSVQSFSRFVEELAPQLQNAEEFVRTFVQRGGQ